MTVTEFLKDHVPFLAGLSQDEARALAGTAEQITYRPNQTILLQGETVDSLHVVATGKVAVTIRPRGKQAVRVAELGPGKVFGEASILEQGVASASVKALEETLLFVVPQETFRNVLASNPCVKESILARIASRRPAQQE